MWFLRRKCPKGNSLVGFVFQKFSWAEVMGVISEELSGVDIQIPMPDYKSVRAGVICHSG